MKRILLFAVCFAMVFSLTSCLVDTHNVTTTTTVPFTLSSEVFEDYHSEVASSVEPGAVTKIYRSDSYDSAQIRDFFLDTALNGSVNSRQIISRWAQHIDYYIDGTISNSEREYMENIIITVNGIGIFPGMTQTDIESDAELIIRYTSRNTLYKHFDVKDTVYTDESSNTVVEHATSAGFFTVDTSTGEIRKAEIGISIEGTTPSQRNAAFAKEFLKICGLPFKSDVYEDSLLYSGTLTASQPDEVDYIALELLYNEKLRMSASFSEAFITVVDILTN